MKKALISMPGYNRRCPVAPLNIYIYIYIYIIKNNFISTFGKTNLIHLTTNVMFSGQLFAILDVFIWNPKLKLKCPYIYLNAWTTATGCKIDWMKTVFSLSFFRRGGGGRRGIQDIFKYLRSFTVTFFWIFAAFIISNFVCHYLFFKLSFI